MPDPVECRSDSQYAERPLALHWQGERLEVLEILARRRTPQGQWFRVRAGRPRQQAELIFDLQYDDTADAWQISPL